MTVFLLWCLSFVDLFLPPTGTAYMSTADPATVAGFLQGRLLFCCLKKGMTGKQVEGILGRPDASFLTGATVVDGYSRYGIKVWFFSRDDGKLSQCNIARLVIGIPSRTEDGARP